MRKTAPFKNNIFWRSRFRETRQCFQLAITWASGHTDAATDQKWLDCQPTNVKGCARQSSIQLLQTAVQCFGYQPSRSSEAARSQYLVDWWPPFSYLRRFPKQSNDVSWWRSNSIKFRVHGQFTSAQSASNSLAEFIRQIGAKSWMLPVWSASRTNEVGVIGRSLTDKAAIRYRANAPDVNVHWKL